MMTGQFATMASQASFNGGAEPEVVNTRFGPVTIQRHNPVTLAQGPLGMPDKQLFCLSDFPSAKMQRFKLLQCLDDLELSFITLPLEINNPVISSDDIAAACKELGIAHANLGLLVIVSVHRSVDSVKLSVNARAPIFVDTSTKQAVQHVFTADKYLVQHFITA